MPGTRRELSLATSLVGNDSLQRWLPGLADFMREHRCSVNTAARYLACSMSDVDLNVEASPNLLARICNALIDALRMPATSDSTVAAYVRSLLENRLDRDEADGWANAWNIVSNDRTFTMFSALCWISYETQSRCLGQVLCSFLNDNVGDLICGDSEDIMRWARSISKSGMGRSDMEHCLRLLASAEQDPRSMSMPNRFDRTYSLQDRDGELQVGGRGRIGARPRWALGYRSFSRPSDRCLGDFWPDDRQRMRARSVAGLRRSESRVQEQVENVLDAADVLQDESRALARIAYR